MFNAFSILGQSLFPLESLESKFLHEAINGSADSLRNLYHEAKVLNIKNIVINVRDLRCQSALHWAIQKGNIQSAELIIQLGANVNTAINAIDAIDS